MSSQIAEKPRVDEFLLAYRGYSATPGICHVVIAPQNGSAPRALVGELDDNPGTSTTNAIEEVAVAISRHLLDGTEDFSLFQYQPHGLPDLRPEFYAIDWKGGRPFRWPVWERVEASTHPWLSSVRRYVSAEDYTRGRIEERARAIDASRDPRVAPDSMTERIGSPHDREPPPVDAVDLLEPGIEGRPMTQTATWWYRTAVAGLRQDQIRALDAAIATIAREHDAPLIGGNHVLEALLRTGLYQRVWPGYAEPRS